MIVTIDGPAGSGKSTVSRLLAKKLGFNFLDTGAMYRAVTLLFIQNGIHHRNTEKINALLDNIQISFDDEKVFLNGRDVGDEIRMPEIDRQVSEVSALKQVREKIVPLQREITKKSDFVAEGRDMGSVVFPDADVKIYLDASVEERARRRLAQYPGRDLSLEEIMRDIERRDRIDSSRAISPLKIPDGAVVIDTTGLSIDGVLDRIYEVLQSSRISK